MPINKRNIRELRKNFLRHFGIFVLILTSSLVMVGISSSIDSVITAVTNMFHNCNVEDGYVECVQELSQEAYDKITLAGMDIEDESYFDVSIENDKILRVFSNRSDINLIEVIQGGRAPASGEVVLSKGFAETNGYYVGDEIQIDGKSYQVAGYAASPDYVIALRDLSDAVSYYDKFGLCYMNENDAADYFSSIDVTYHYSYLLNGHDDEALYDLIAEDNFIISKVKAEDNPRITNYESDVSVIKNVSLVIAVVLVIIVAFVIYNYISSVVESECVVIGTLYALGYVRKELCMHYIYLPAVIVSAASIVGSILGILFGGIFVQSVIYVYNFPDIAKMIQPYHLLLGIAFPIIMVLVINLQMLLRRLSIEPLKLLRKDIKKKKRVIHAKMLIGFSFLKRFKIKEMISNLSNYFVLSTGVILSTFLILFSMGIWNSISNYISAVEDEIAYQYSYYLTSADGLEDFDDTEKVYQKEMALVMKDETVNSIVLSGIDTDCIFYDFSIPEEDGVYISDNISKKFGLNKGDTISLKEIGENKSYNLTVKDVVAAKSGLLVFMNRLQMSEMLGEKNDYYNVLLSKSKLDIDKDYVYQEVTKENVTSDVESIMNRLIPLCIMILIISVCICVLLTFILIKIQFDRSSFSVALVGVFGYNTKELSSVYLFPIKVSLFSGIVVGLPLSYLLFGLIWPTLIGSMQTYIDIRYNWYSFLFIIIIYVVCYAFSVIWFRTKLKTVDYVTVMKARE